MSESAHSPLARLVLFMVCLSVAGAFVAGAYYVTVDLPQQNAIQAPANTDPASCIMKCSNTARACYEECSEDGICIYTCEQTAGTCAKGCSESAL